MGVGRRCARCPWEVNNRGRMFSMIELATAGIKGGAIEEESEIRWWRKKSVARF